MKIIAESTVSNKVPRITTQQFCRRQNNFSVLTKLNIVQVLTNLNQLFSKMKIKSFNIIGRCENENL